MLRAAPFVLLIAAGCGGQGPADNSSKIALTADTSQPAAAPTVAAHPVKIDASSELLQFHLAWPAEVSAIPTLAEKIRVPAMAHKAELLQMATDDKVERDKHKFPFNPYQYGADYKVEGVSPRLLSLSDTWFEFTGGAHPMHGTRALLWDRTADREISFADLFQGGIAKVDTLFKSAYCAGLDKARIEMRGPGQTGAVVGPDDPFNQCPQFSDLTLLPGGTAGQPMTTVTIHADPYLAGPYSEGDYDVEIPITAAAIAALKPEYRSSFAAR